MQRCYFLHVSFIQYQNVSPIYLPLIYSAQSYGKRYSTQQLTDGRTRESVKVFVSNEWMLSIRHCHCGYRILMISDIIVEQNSSGLAVIVRRISFVSLLTMDSEKTSKRIPQKRRHGRMHPNKSEGFCRIAWKRRILLSIVPRKL